MKREGYYQRSWTLWVKLLVVGILVFLIDGGGRLRWMRRSFEWVLSPVSGMIGKTEQVIGNWEDKVKFVKSGAVKMVDLERQVAELSTTVQRVNELDKENAQLREQLRLLPDVYVYQSGKVISVVESVMMVSVRAGEVNKGALVLWQNGLVGVVESVGAWNVQIRLISGVESEIPVKLIDVSGRDVGEAVLSRDFSSGLVLSQILQESGVSVGNLVVTTGAAGLVPAELVIGNVSRVIGEDSDVYKQAVVESMFKPKVGEVVYIVRGLK